MDEKKGTKRPSIIYTYSKVKFSYLLPNIFGFLFPFFLCVQIFTFSLNSSFSLDVSAQFALFLLFFRLRCVLVFGNFIGFHLVVFMVL